MLVANFLRRWSTIEINAENALLFDEHLMGVRAIAEQSELQFLNGISTNTPRTEFARRYRILSMTEE